MNVYTDIVNYIIHQKNGQYESLVFRSFWAGAIRDLLRYSIKKKDLSRRQKHDRFTLRFS